MMDVNTVVNVRTHGHTCISVGEGKHIIKMFIY